MRFILIVFILLISTSAKADSYIDSLFAKGNSFYHDEQYSSAIESYNEILDSNYVSFELYYNLGNSYFQFGKIPKSILQYEKALLIDKGNKVCINNLELARNRIDMIEPIPRLFYVNWWNNFSSTLSLNGWSILLIISVWLLCIFIILFIKNRKKWIFNSMISIISLCLIFIFAMISSNDKQNEKTAIIMTNSKLFSTPNLENQLGEVKAGNKAIVKEIVSNSVLIRLEDGQEAFLEASDISFIK